MGVARMQYMQVIPSQLQAELDSPGILFSAAGPAGSRVGAD